jgi:hypothetical protein
MASLATESRPAIIGAFLLTLVMWLECHPSRIPINAALVPVAAPAIMELALELGPLHDVSGLITPAPHPDARAWPRGMVIHPPATHDRIQAELTVAPTPLDILLSALLGPWLALAS